jgi:hypothetical protein
MTHPLDYTDGVETYRYRQEDGRLYRLHTSNNEDAILEENAAVRGSGGPRKFAWGRQIASIPLATWGVLIKRHPGLASNDPDERFRAWERFSHDSDYRKLTFGD